MNILKSSFLKQLGLMFVTLILVSTNVFATRISFTSVKFFESGYEAIDRSYRTYKDTFMIGETRYVFAELEVRNLWLAEPHNFHVRAEYFRPDGATMGGPQNTFTISPSWKIGHFWVGWGWPQPGNWTPGRHRVDIYIDNALVATQFFTMTHSGTSSDNRNDLPPPQNYGNTKDRNDMPAPQNYGTTNLPYSLWMIKNDTSHNLFINYQGPKSESVTVPPYSSREMYLNEGNYTIQGSLSKESVKPFYKQFYFRTGQKYQSRFHIQTHRSETRDTSGTRI